MMTRRDLFGLVAAVAIAPIQALRESQPDKIYQLGPSMVLTRSEYHAWRAASHLPPLTEFVGSWSMPSE